MRHSRRTTLATTDISQALRVLNIEPLYGYDSLRKLTFGEASVGPAQPIFYVEDEEVDFEKLINAPLPKVTREVTFTTHWLAIEGVQPATAQNPTHTEAARLSEGTPKGSNATSSLAATAGNNDVNIKPQVKHILSKEHQLYFERVCSIVMDEGNESIRASALSSLRKDTGLHQLLPYFLQFVSEKVTHRLKDMFVLNQIMDLVHALLDNETLFIANYVFAHRPRTMQAPLTRSRSPASSPHPHLSGRQTPRRSHHHPALRPPRLRHLAHQARLRPLRPRLAPAAPASDPHLFQVLYGPCKATAHALRRHQGHCRVRRPGGRAGAHCPQS
jgi:transcription initiation factor TFIID subunit 6